jgi:hypothetical protein
MNIFIKNNTVVNSSKKYVFDTLTFYADKNTSIQELFNYVHNKSGVPLAYIGFKKGSNVYHWKTLKMYDVTFRTKLYEILTPTSICTNGFDQFEFVCKV